MRHERTEKRRAIPVHHMSPSTPLSGWPVPTLLPPKARTRRYVTMAPRGAAKEKMTRRFRIAGWSSESESRVVVRPSAVGPDVTTYQLLLRAR